MSSLLENITSDSIYLTLPATLLVAAVGIIFYRLSLHPLAHFPGPFEAKLSGSWRNRHYWQGQWHEDVVQLHKKYGPAVRIAPNELSLVDADALRLLYNHGTKAVKTDWYWVWQAPNAGPALFSALDKNIHAYLRKRVSAAYSMSSMLKYEDYMQECLDLMLQKLKKHAKAGNEVDMAKWAGYLAFDTVGSLGYGAPLGMLETESDVMALQENIHQGFTLMSNMGHYWGQARWLTNPYTMKMMEILGVPNFFDMFDKWTMKKLEARKQSENKEERLDMLSHFLKMKAPDGGPADDKDVLMEALNVIGAGADTTSIAMRACLYYLCKTPDAYRRIQQEIDEYYRSKGLRQPITYQQTLELPFFCAVTREATRLFPSIGYQLLRYAPADMIVEGKRIPIGTVLGMSPTAANRDPQVWGEDADEFNPSRWLSDEDKVRHLNTHDLTFGGTGPRTCIGRNIALIELHKFLAQFLHHFDAEFVDPEKPWRVQCMFFSNQHDMHMRIKYRNGLGDD
ncbi:hypothetical protein M409DRAFT_20702 [Zasmidium cellare ATCC 36951]|uniref:Cytochrome P450 n=1 Tax=Zasmidium cellare ATCC 36951 TaxID=1080233 RepID=A0A6A6CTH8_ZASCE|nr:uncharacterized protein M409DRAFT_20702 [Zasmidium cellare ATCC 36951]KAF2169488.1 hypothetical protein M409DRAFT_20702 [Zasmidium cellare ATCC 36951]